MISDADKKRMEFAEKVSEKSPDSTKAGCVIMNAAANKAVFGYNHFMEGVKQTDKRKEGSDKYRYTVHAEEHAITEALRIGVDIHKGTAYLNWVPCSTCFRLLVRMAGVVRLVCKKRDEHPYFNDDHSAVEDMAKELGIKIDYVTD